MEQLIKSLTTADILSIDFDLAIDNDCYAQTSILRGTPRCKAFYCFRNDDTREDGEDRLSQDSFASICCSIAQLLSDNDSASETHLKYEITITTDDKHKYSFKSLQATKQGSESLPANTLKAIINLLTDHIAEFSFLVAFQPYI